MSVATNFHRPVSVRVDFYDNDTWACIKILDDKGNELNIFTRGSEFDFLQKLRDACKLALATL